jgi:muramoyltetrapeptide carboxypeptidase
MIRPPALFPGARVALVAPAGPVAADAVDRAVARVREWGWEPLVGTHAGGRNGYLSGTDQERAADVNWALSSADVDAVWCLRGGYGTMRLVDSIDWDAVPRRPRAVIGFSDNTVLHLALQRAGVVSFHGPHPATPDFPLFSEQVLHSVLLRAEPAGALPFPPGEAPRARTLAPGRAEGPLVGGNLSLIAATLGTPYAVRAAGAILFLEEIGEAAYRVDRLLSQLLLAGVFREVAGVAIGAFSECGDDGDSGILLVEEIIRERLEGLRIPVAAGFPFGHIANNWTLPVGTHARLDADAGTLDLLEAAVT